MIAFREVRHFQPDDCLHYETIAARGREYHWTIPAHRHSGLHQVHLLSRGAVEGSIDGAPLRVKAPALWIIAPGTVHAFAYARGSAGRQATLPSAGLLKSLGASPALVARLERSIVLDPGALGAETAAVEDLFARIADEFGASRPGRAEALAALATLLVLKVVRLGAPPAPALRQAALRDALTHRFRSLIELHFRRERSLDFYAVSLGVTPDHLSRVCRATTGMSALALLHERLMLEARRQLAHSTATAASISADLGFDDPAYFSRFFSRAAGVAPRAYRARVADGREAPPGPPSD
ncbi:MAG: helix-turn-helix domain-containing protein [Burkholderiales bacterium]